MTGQHYRRHAHTPTRIARRLGIGFCAVALAVAGGAGYNPATASPGSGTVHKVTLCHRTASDTNPYVEETVDVIAGGLRGGHQNHNGPVWNATLKPQHIKWGDIIPAFDYTEFSYAGKNLTGAGLAILNNNCVVPPTEVTPAVPQATTPSCDTPTMTVSVTPTTGVIYTPSLPKTLAPGASVTVTATAADGFVLAAGTHTWSFTNEFNPQTCPSVVTPRAPTASTPDCTVPTMTVTLPSGPVGVTYTPDGALVLAPGDSVTVTATAQAGFALAEGATAQWTFTNEFNPQTCPAEVTPTAPTASTPNCTVPTMTVTLPSGPVGVTYTPSGDLTLAQDDTVTITATADDGFVLAATATTQWTFTNTFDPTSCTGDLVVVKPAEPTASTATCANPTMTVTLPTTDGVVYTASGALELNPGQSVTITPSAQEGFQLAGDVAPVKITNDLDTSTCSGTEPQPPLAATGSGLIWAEFGLAMGLILLGGALMAASRRIGQTR